MGPFNETANLDTQLEAGKTVKAINYMREALRKAAKNPSASQAAVYCL